MFNSRTSPVVTLFSPDGDPSGTPNPPVVPKPDLEAIIDSKIDSILSSKKANGDKDEALRILARSLHAQEVRATTAEQQRDEARGQALDQATRDRLAAYEAYGTPEELKARIEAGEGAIQKRAELERKEAARLLKLDPEKHLFNKLLDGVDFEIQGEGDERKAMVKTEKGAVSFEDYAKTRPDLQEALPLLGGTTQADPDRRPAYLRTAPAGGGKVANEWDRIRAEKKQKQEERQATPPATWQEKAGLAV